MSIVVNTERVWTLQPDGLYTREGSVIVGETDAYTEERDLLGPVQIEAGLRANDTIVFLGVIGIGPLGNFAKTETYFVTRIDDSDGSGILVADDLAKTHPPSWLYDYAVRQCQRMHELGYSYSELGLSWVDTYVRSLGHKKI